MAFGTVIEMRDHEQLITTLDDLRFAVVRSAAMLSENMRYALGRVGYPANVPYGEGAFFDLLHHDTDDNNE